MKKNEFHNFVKSIILEVKKEKKVSDEKEKSKDYLNNEEPKYKRDVDKKHDESTSKLIKSIRAIVNKIGKGINVVGDVRGNVVVEMPEMFYVKITPKWSGIYDVEAFKDLTDRIYAVGLSYQQILDFIKVNFSKDKTGYVQSAYDKSMNNIKDSSEKKSKDLPKGEVVKHKEVFNKDKEDLSKDHDQSNSLETIKEKDIERQEDHGIEKPKTMSSAVKMSKKTIDDELVTSDFGNTSKMSKKV